MSEKATNLRNEWIERRARDGWDFTALVREMADVVVRPGDHGTLVIDISAIEPNPNYPTVVLLEPVENDLWYFAGTNQDAPLVEWIITLALSVVERKAKP